MNEIGILFALAGGLLSFFSPCVFPLLPAYVTHLTSGKIEGSQLQKEKTKNMGGSILLGMAFATGWSPCVGLALSSILLLASSSDTLMQGVFLLGAYSLGMAIPFFIISVIISYSLNTMRKINRYLSKLAFINGVVMILLGFLVLSGQMQKISAWLSAYSLF
ncbi:hypothetical protein FZC84_00650 [Rossellomorea vietnamensis]|uniref:Cytochrome C biogenesis protein transmembrane domain-containing protein n=1 Tax=Rossellomorea vietnamensis TaxID=218284 RepID=A0A5D4MHK0_9BACI|nr:cytochrome c biogenesis protein CcdA [Rossellomorea vietnamensis]TYS01213.1 hypothetical protein FZC84_00650 [Rossellomorea vietnamensis]